MGLSASIAFASDDEAAGKELTTLYRSARKVISDNQDLINDATKGNKGLTAEKVVQETKENFQKATGSPLNLKNDKSVAAKARLAMLSAVEDVINEAQPLINTPGKGFKGFLPAVFAGRVAVKFNTAMEGRISIKLTAPRAYVRNRANRPDDWENNVIESLFKMPSYPRGAAHSEQIAVGGRPAYRYILPEYYGPSCLACHGEPKGTIDITGGKREGGKLDELGGAISLIIVQ